MKMVKMENGRKMGKWKMGSKMKNGKNEKWGQ